MTGRPKGCLDVGCEIKTSACVMDLIQDETGRVIAVTAYHDGKEIRMGVTKGVILPTGGFGWDSEMLNKYFPLPIDNLGFEQSS